MAQVAAPNKNKMLVALVLVLAMHFFPGCGEAPLKTVDGIIPENSVVALRTDSLARFAPSMNDFLKTIPGGEGVIDFIKSRTGLKLSEKDGWERFGVEARVGFHAFIHEGHGYFVLGARDERRLREGVSDWIKRGRSGNKVFCSPTSLKGCFSVTSRDEESAGLYCGIGNRILGCTKGQNKEEALVRIESLTNRPLEGPSFWGSEERNDGSGEETEFGLRVKFAGGASEDYRVAVDGAFGDLFSSLGNARFALAAVPVFFKQLGEGTGEVRLAGKKVSANFSQEMDEQSLAQFQGMFRFGAAAPVYDWLPRDTPLTNRMHINSDGLLNMYRSMAGFLPKAELGTIHPLLRGVTVDKHFLEHWGGEFSFAFLGLREKLLLSQLAKPSLLGAFLSFEFAFVLSLKDADAFFKAWAEHPSPKGAYEWIPIPALEGERAGGRIRSRTGKGLSLAFIPKGDCIIVVNGRGAYPLVRDVLEERRTPLIRRMDSKRFRESEATGQNVMSFYLGPGGFMRDLARRGLPSFFLSQISRIYEAWGSVGLADDRLWIALEVTQ